MLERVEVGDMVFIAEGQEGIGAVRQIHKDAFVLFVENAGEFDIPATAIVGVHDRKVIINPARLARGVLDAVGHAHDREDPKLVG
jgi:hypothetical protein